MKNVKRFCQKTAELTGLAVFVCLSNFASADDVERDGYVSQGISPLVLTAPGEGFINNTYLLDVRQGSPLSDKVKSVRTQQYELADGQKVTMDKWYTSAWKDFRVLMMTQVTDNAGVIWGISTGERAEKYVIDPALTVGFIYRWLYNKSTTISFSGMAVVGGKLKEKTCTADYGAIGGVQQVNCRLAASVLSPEETLQYLMNERPRSDNNVSIKLTYRF